MKDIIVILLLLFSAPFILTGLGIMVSAIFSMIAAAFMFVIPAAFIGAWLFFIGQLLNTGYEQTTLARPSGTD
jgi:hypothetical protein